MRVTTVASVTEKNKIIPNFLRKQLLRILFDRYVIIHHAIHPHDPCDKLNINTKQQNAAADAYGAPSRNDNLPQRKQLLHATFDRYVLIRSTIRSRDLISTLIINEKQQNIVSDTCGPPPSSSIFLSSSTPATTTSDDG